MSHTADTSCSRGASLSRVVERLPQRFQQRHADPPGSGSTPPTRHPPEPPASALCRHVMDVTSFWAGTSWPAPRSTPSTCCRSAALTSDALTPTHTAFSQVTSRLEKVLSIHLRHSFEAFI